MFGLNAFSKKNLLKRKISVTEGAIIQREIDIDVHWRLLNLKQKEKDEVLKKILAAEKEYKDEDAKPYYDGKGEKVAELKQAAVDVGWTGRKMKDGKPVYEGEIVKIESAIEHFLSEIKSFTVEREFLKIQLICLKKMQKDGYDPEIEAFKNEKMEEIMAE